MKLIVNEAYQDFMKDDSRTVVLMGGAGSGKSRAAAQKLILRMTSEFNHTFLVLRKVSRGLRNSVYEELKTVIYDLGLQDDFSMTTIPMEIVFKRNNNRIMFMGLDDPEKIKSIIATSIWVEEATEITKQDYLQLNLRLRGETKSYKQIVLSFNPISAMHWLKEHFFDSPKENVSLYRTTYKDNQFLTNDDIREIENLKQVDQNTYQVYALGEWGTFSDAIIYKNWEVIPNLSLNVHDYDTTIAGVDFAFTSPSAFLLVGVDNDKNLYVLKEIYEKRLLNSDLIKLIKNTIDWKHQMIVGDSAELDRITEMKQQGLKALPAKKGKYSVRDGIDFIKRRKIFINPSCTNFINEIKSYSWHKDHSTDEIYDVPVKINDHLMDALRYACDLIKVNRKLKAGIRIY